jgi:hypothetical protein
MNLAAIAGVILAIALYVMRPRCVGPELCPARMGRDHDGDGRCGNCPERRRA